MRLVGALCIPIGLLLLPFADHRSRDPVLLTYSRDYLLVLAMLAAGGVAVAFALAWMVRGAPPKRRLAFALVLLAVPVAAVLVLEVYLGYRERDVFAAYREWGHAKSPFMGFEAAPNHRWEKRGAVYTTDADSFRTHQAPRVAPEKETLIALLGGSTVFGTGLNDDETWPHCLERALRTRFGETITVLNAANMGHNSLQQLIRYYLRVLPQQPEYVLYYGLATDIRTVDEMRDLPISMPPELLETYSIRDHLRTRNAGKGVCFENSVLLNRLKDIVEEVATGRNTAGPSQGPAALDMQFQRRFADGESMSRTYGPALEAYLRNLDSLRLLCEANGCKFVIVTEVSNRPALPPTWAIPIDYFSRALLAHCRDKGIPLIDLLGAFDAADNKDELFLENDRAHTSSKGAEFIAARVADALTPMIAHDQAVARQEGDSP